MQLQHFGPAGVGCAHVILSRLPPSASSTTTTAPMAPTTPPPLAGADGSLAERDAARAEADSIRLELDRLASRDTELHQVLRDHGVGPRFPPLVGSDGFPIPDVDHLAVATARGELARIYNDSRALEQRLWPLLQAALPAAADAGTASEPAASSANASRPMANGSGAPPARAFARIGSVAPSSPAEAAGLQAGDELLTVLAISQLEARTRGERVRVTADQPSPLQALPPLVHDGQPIVFVVLRDARSVTCMLTPRVGWGGRGLLGCHLQPL